MFKNIQFVKSVYDLENLPPPKLPEIAFLGRSNVGKSSLINAFLNRKKIAKVSSTPGFTKSINIFQVDNKFLLVDLPGYGFAKAPVKLIQHWKKLVEGYLTSQRNFKLLILIFDIRRTPDNLDKNLISFVKYIKKPYCIVLNKIDTLSKNEIKKQKLLWEKELFIPENILLFLVSCKTKEGIENFRKSILQLINF